jgi:putative DNA primase/helicase
MTAPAQLGSWAQALGGEASGSGVICPGPGHSAKDRSLSVTLSATLPDGFMVYSHAGNDWQACRDHVRERLGLPPFRPGLPQKRALGARHGAPCHKGSGEPAKAATQSLDNYNRAMAIWWSGIEPRGTLVEVYLRSQRLELPGEDAWEAIRFQPSCHFGLSERYPAMVCLVRNIVTNEPQGIHRTALTPDGTAVKRNGKTFRMSLGPTSEGAVKIDPDDARPLHRGRRRDVSRRPANGAPAGLVRREHGRRQKFPGPARRRRAPHFQGK